MDGGGDCASLPLFLVLWQVGQGRDKGAKGLPARGQVCPLHVTIPWAEDACLCLPALEWHSSL